MNHVLLEITQDMVGVKLVREVSNKGNFTVVNSAGYRVPLKFDDDAPSELAFAALVEALRIATDFITTITVEATTTPCEPPLWEEDQSLPPPPSSSLSAASSTSPRTPAC